MSEEVALFGQHIGRIEAAVRAEYRRTLGPWKTNQNVSVDVVDNGFGEAQICTFHALLDRSDGDWQGLNAGSVPWHIEHCAARRAVLPPSAELDPAALFANTPARAMTVLNRPAEILDPARSSC